MFWCEKRRHSVDRWPKCREIEPSRMDSIINSFYLFISCTVCVVIAVCFVRRFQLYNCHYGHCTLPPSLSLSFSLFLCHCFGQGGGGEAGGGPGLRGDKVQANGRKSLKFAAAAFHLSTEGAPWPQTPALILSLSPRLSLCWPLSCLSPQHQGRAAG